MANTVPDGLKSHRHRPARRGARGGLRGARYHRHLQPPAHPGGRPPGHGSTHATDGRHQSAHATHVPNPDVPTTRSHVTPNRPDSALQIAVLPTEMPPPTTYHPAQDPPPQGPAPSTTNNNAAARISTTSTTRTPASMRTPQAPKSPCHHPSMGTDNRHPPQAPSAYAYGGQRWSCPSSRATRCA